MTHTAATSLIVEWMMIGFMAFLMLAFVFTVTMAAVSLIKLWRL